MVVPSSAHQSSPADSTRPSDATFVPASAIEYIRAGLESRNHHPLLYIVVLVGLVCIIFPNIIAFGWSVRRGLAFIDWFYPWPQNHRAFLKHPVLIRSHVVLNGASLLLGFGLVFHEHALVEAVATAATQYGGGYGLISTQPEDQRDHVRESFRLLLLVYTALLVGGTTMSIRFSARNAVHRTTGTVAFGFMAAASVFPACTAVFLELFGDFASEKLRAPTFARTRAHLIRSFAAQFGAGVCFRVLAVSVMGWVPNQHKREAWLILIFGSWWLPSALCDMMWVPGLGVFASVGE